MIVMLKNIMITKINDIKSVKIEHPKTNKASQANGASKNSDIPHMVKQKWKIFGWKKI